MSTEEEEDGERLVFADEAARIAGIKPRTWRKYVQSQLAPPPDDPDLDRPAARRMPRWKVATVRHFTTHRVGRGRRSDLLGSPYAKEDA